MDSPSDPQVTFESAGFEVVPGIVPEAGCESLIGLTRSLGIRGAGTRELLAQKWCEDLASRLVSDDRLQERLAGLTPVQCTYFEKSEESNWLVAYHQDLSVPVRCRIPSRDCVGWSEKEGVTYVQPPRRILESLVAVRLHLDESDADNGPLRVISGSHVHGRIKSSEVAGLRARLGEVVCLAPQGAVLLFKPLLLHASSKALTPRPRRVLHFLFGPPALPLGLRWHAAVE